MAKIKILLEINLTTRGSFTPVTGEDGTLFRPPTVTEFAGIIARDLQRRLADGTSLIKSADVKIL